MFDLNTIITQALTAAVATAVDARLTEVLQQHANIVGALAERITALEARVVALENNPAIGVDTTLAERIAALETKLTEAALFERNINVQTLITPETVVNSMNNAEWLWEKINAYIETGIDDRIERAIDDHCSTYNHDDYDNVYNEWGGESVDDFVKDGYLEDQIEEKVNETLRNASFEIRVL
jgi:hypothetical protein